MESDPNNNFDAVRFNQLMADRCNGTLSSDGRQELDDAVKASPEARAAYWELMSVHADLRWMFSGNLQCGDRFEKCNLDEFDGVFPPHVAARGKAAFVGMRRGALMAVAVVVPLCAAVISWTYVKRQPATSAGPTTQLAEETQVLGQLAALSKGSRWTFGTPGEKNRPQFMQGDTLWLNHGAAELKFSNGVVAQLEAPLILELLSSDSGRVLRGRITMDVPEGMKGFTIETAAAEVVDLGTTFSVDVTEVGETDVIVFQGEVDVNTSHVASPAGTREVGSKRRLFKGEAVRVTEDGRLSRIINVRRTNFSDAGVEGVVVGKVRDNVVQDRTMKYYEIVAGGMREDAKAFVDRVHEWNGSASKGIPDYLLGGDYIKTFNDDKVIKDYQVTIALERPANVYLLVDDRMDQTDWLLSQFEDTGDDVGLDEGINYPNDPRRVEVGPGNSIDEVHSIWKLRQPANGAVTIGPFPVSQKASGRGKKAKLNMFGIVAVPLR